MTDTELRNLLSLRIRMINSPESHFLQGTLDAAGVRDLHAKWDAILADEAAANQEADHGN